MPATILIIGQHQRPEFRAALAVLRPLGRLVTARGLVHARRLVGGGLPPERIVLVQTRPAQFAESAVLSLRRAAPAAGWLLVTGNWCEGELRSGNPLAGIRRLAWHQLNDAPRTPAEWFRPATWTEEERLLADLSACSTILAGIRAAVTGSDLEAVAVLEHGLVAAGATVVAVDTTPSPEVLVVDLSEIAAWSSSAPAPHDRGATGAPALVAVVGFPRSQDAMRLQRAGVRAIVSKPYTVSQLARAVRHALDRPRHEAATSARVHPRSRRAPARSG